MSKVSEKLTANEVYNLMKKNKAKIVKALIKDLKSNSGPPGGAEDDRHMYDWWSFIGGDSPQHVIYLEVLSISNEEFESIYPAGDLNDHPMIFDLELEYQAEAFSSIYDVDKKTIIKYWSKNIPAPVAGVAGVKYSFDDLVKMVKKHKNKLYDEIKKSIVDFQKKNKGRPHKDDCKGSFPGFGRWNELMDRVAVKGDDRQDINYFDKIFLDVSGITPKEYIDGTYRNLEFHYFYNGILDSVVSDIVRP